MKTQLDIFFAALRFFTRLPVPARIDHAPELLDRAARYLPLVGIVVGTIGAVVTVLALKILPSSVAVLLGMLATILVTGAFHEDGLADAADGLGGGWDKTQVLAIMKDSRIGNYGAVALLLALAFKFHAVQGLPWELMAPALIAGHAASRFAAVMLMHQLDYVRDDDSARARPLTQRMGRGDLVLAGAFGLLPFALLLYWWMPWQNVLLAIVLAAAVTVFAARYFVRRLGGYTGDCLGATQQVAEIAIYIGLLCNFSL